MAPIFERSKETDLLVTALRGVNRSVSYEALCQQTGLTLGQMKKVLSSARVILKGENILFDTEWGVGLVRLTDAEKVQQSGKRKRRIYNQAKYGTQDLNTIENFGALSNSDQLTATTDRTIFRLTMDNTRAARRRKETPKVASSPIPDISRFKK